MRRLFALGALTIVIALSGVAGARAQQPPPVPAPLQPLLPVFGPAAAPGCRVAGLAGSSLASRGLPQAYQALNPAFVVCGYVPPPTAPVACPADKPVETGVRSVAPALGSLLPIPTPLATTVDSFTALNALVAAQSGSPLPAPVISLLLATSGCVVPKAPPAARGNGSFGLGGPAPALPAAAVAELETARASAGPDSAVPPFDVAVDDAPAVSPGRAEPSVAASTPPAFADDWGARLITAGVLFALLSPLVVRSGAAR